MPDRCRNCRSSVRRRDVAIRREVGGRVFVMKVPGRPCTVCASDGVDPALHRQFSLMVAADTGAHATGGAVRFTREALGLLATDLAELLDVSVGTLSRWENSRRSVPRVVSSVMMALARDALEGRTSTLDALRAFSRRAPARKVVTIVLPEADARRLA